MRKLVRGVGINDLDGFMSVKGKHLRFYTIWSQILARCYSETTQKKAPTYVGCTMCDEWKYLSNFKKWFDENYREGLHLDKDILFEGNKVYSPETCRFVPQYLNSLLTDARAVRGDLPLGVSVDKPGRNRKATSTYNATCSDGSGKHIMRTFKTIDEASAWYSKTKKRVVKEQAQRAFLANEIKTDVYLALVRREF